MKRKKGERKKKIPANSARFKKPRRRRSCNRFGSKSLASGDRSTLLSTV
jgi:hypothetical protein